MLAESPRRFRQVALAGGLAVAGALLGAASARGAWESPTAIDNAGGYGATSTTQTGFAAGPDGLTSVLFLQPPPSATNATPFMVRRSAGASAAWGAPSAVALPAGKLGVIPNPALAAAGGGALGSGGTLGLIGFQPPSGGGEVVSTTWPAAAAGPSGAVPALCTSASTPECATNPQVTFDGSGAAYAVGVASGTDILFARTGPADAWQPPSVIAQGTSPLLAVDPGGDVVVTYVRSDNSTPGVTDNHEYAIREPAGQAAFSAEHQISGPNSVSGSGSSPAALVIDNSGTATVVFEEDTVPPNFFNSLAPVVEAVRWPLSQSKPAAEQQVSGSDTSEGTPGNLSLAVGPAGDGIVAWAGSSTTSAIYAAQLTGGVWGSPQSVSPSNGRSASAPLVAVDPSGTVTLVYTDSMPPTFNDVDVKASRLPPAGSWSSPVSLRSTDPNAGAVQTLSAHLVATRSGQADVIFGQQLGGANRLLATRFDDTTPPSIQIVTPQDGATYKQGTTVQADYSCADEPGGSGVVACTGAVTDGQAVDTSHPGANTFTVTASDGAGNAATKTIHYTVQPGPPPKDTTPPAIKLAAPADGAVYVQYQRVIARFSCADPDSAVSKCRGTVASGYAIDTRSLGRHSFSVVAQDPAGNTASKTVHYNVRAAPPAPVALKLTVVPGHVRTGHAARLRFRAASCASGRCRGVQGVQISFRHRIVRTDRRGYATIAVTVRKAGRYKAYASAPGYRRASVVVIARAR